MGQRLRRWYPCLRALYVIPARIGGRGPTVWPLHAERCGSTTLLSLSGTVPFFNPRLSSRPTGAQGIRLLISLARHNGPALSLRIGGYLPHRASVVRFTPHPLRWGAHRAILAYRRVHPARLVRGEQSLIVFFPFQSVPHLRLMTCGYDVSDLVHLHKVYYRTVPFRRN